MCLQRLKSATGVRNADSQRFMQILIGFNTVCPVGQQPIVNGHSNPLSIYNRDDDGGYPLVITQAARILASMLLPSFVSFFFAYGKKCIRF